MNWTDYTDGYCERLDPGVWAEPVNALTNAGFLVAALVMALRLRGQSLPIANMLVGILLVIGAGSYLFHTYARIWAAAADSVPILVFVLVYIYAATRDLIGTSPRIAGWATAGFLPYAGVTVPLFWLVPGLGDSAGYAPLPLLIAVYAALMARQAPATARNLAIGAALLALSIAFRALDMPLCTAWPMGTHFLWHLLNAIMLGWMIELYRRHMLAGAGTGR